MENAAQHAAAIIQRPKAVKRNNYRPAPVREQGDRERTIRARSRQSRLGA
jgi:hypothetical protein